MGKKKKCSKPPTSNTTTLTKQSTGIVLMVNYSHNRKKANPTFIGDGLLKYGIVMNQSNSEKCRPLNYWLVKNGFPFMDCDIPQFILLSTIPMTNLQPAIIYQLYPGVYIYIYICLYVHGLSTPMK